jgi:Mg2+ and Co2+ transporter CorA
MKQTVLVAAIMAAGGAFAQEATRDDVCKSLGELAEQIMQIRQAESPMSDVLKNVVPEEDGSGASDLVRSIVIQAYEMDSMITEEGKASQTARFRNDIELSCFTAGSGG